MLAAGPSVDELVAGGAEAIAAALAGAPAGPVPPGARVLAPLGGREVWAAGVTFERSRQARKEESGTSDPYDLVYEAERPELFLKAAPGRARGPGEAVGVRADSTWDVPEPELAVVADAAGRPCAYTIGDDVSSRSIEGENPLYLPQAKVYRASCALGPCLVPLSEAPALTEMTVRLSIERKGAVLFDQSAPLSGLRRRPAELVEWLYRAQEFPLGAVLLTGTSIVPGPEPSRPAIGFCARSPCDWVTFNEAVSASKDASPADAARLLHEALELAWESPLPDPHPAPTSGHIGSCGLRPWRRRLPPPQAASCRSSSSGKDLEETTWAARRGLLAVPHAEALYADLLRQPLPPGTAEPSIQPPGRLPGPGGPDARRHRRPPSYSRGRGGSPAGARPRSGRRPVAGGPERPAVFIAFSFDAGAGGQ